MFFCAVSEKPEQRTISSDSVTPERHLELLTETFRVTCFFHPRYLGDSAEVNALDRILYDAMGSR